MALKGVGYNYIWYFHLYRIGIMRPSVCKAARGERVGGMMALKPKMRSDVYDNAKLFLIFAVRCV